MLVDFIFPKSETIKNPTETELLGFIIAFLQLLAFLLDGIARNPFFLATLVGDSIRNIIRKGTLKIRNRSILFRIAKRPRDNRD